VAEVATVAGREDHGPMAGLMLIARRAARRTLPWCLRRAVALAVALAVVARTPATPAATAPHRAAAAPGRAAPRDHRR